MLRTRARFVVTATSVLGIVAVASFARMDPQARAATLQMILPNGWVLSAPAGSARQTDTMPQGAAASPDGATLAVVESGFNPASLRLYRTRDLAQITAVPLAGAFGRPLWIDATHVLVAGDNADALFDIDIATHAVRKIAMPAKSHPIAIARSHDIFAVAGDGDGSLRIGGLSGIGAAAPMRVGEHPASIAFSTDGKTVFVSDRASKVVDAINTRSHAMVRLTTDLHPTDVLVSRNTVYVAASDGDTVDMYDARSDREIGRIFVGDFLHGHRLAGASPNALAFAGHSLFVSLGAANSVAVVQGARVAYRLPAGWYPTDIVPVGRRLFVIDGKGEGTHPNPQYRAMSKSFHDYVGAIEYGSIRVDDLRDRALRQGDVQGAMGWNTASTGTVVRPGGPIHHIFFILKENRSYDQVLGDLRDGNGDPRLVLFGECVTPNQHALARRFGIFDNTYASGEVSDAGHNWADAAFSNDYVERYWPPTYGNRRDNDDILTGMGAAAPPNGYIWTDALAAGVSFRDYGEMSDIVRLAGARATTAPGLAGHVDPRYVSWNLNYSDLDRVKEWRNEFERFAQTGTVPKLEYIWLPNDHTYGTRIGKLTPGAYVATNDYAVGQMVDAISHSRIWKSTAIFIIEDDAQDGADHVSDQRTTFYLASPYAKGGVQHAHYSTMSVLRTIEVMLGMKPLSAYDAMAVPLTAAFTAHPNLAPFDVARPRVDMWARNTKNAYGAKVSATLNFSRPDAATPGVLFRIIQCAQGKGHCTK